MLIDTHCHLNDTNAFPDPGIAVDEALGAGLTHLIVVGVDEESSRLAVELADRYAPVWAVVGWHPNYTAKYTDLGGILPLLTHPKVVAIGEVGLDFHWDYATREQQERALFDQLELAAEVELPIVFHCREAYPALLPILEARGPGPYLMHCFAGNKEEALRAIELGSYFGVDGPVTYPKATELRSVIESLPNDRIVLETDSPWLSPVPYRGKPNRPAFLPFIQQVVANLMGQSLEESAHTTSQNALRFFPKISESSHQ
ncbi:MAG: TatD family hydrolase [Fimbriimonas sp.]